MRRITWDSLLVALSLVSIGQQLGTDTKASRAVFEIVSMLISFFDRIS